MPISDIENIYKDMVKDAKLSKIKKQLQKENENEIKFKKMYKLALISRCISNQKVTKKELLELAHKRVNVIQNYLVFEKLVNSSRVKKKDVIILDGSKVDFVKIKLDMEM